MQLCCGLWLQRPELVWSHCRGLDWLSSHCGSATVDPTKHQEYKTYWSRPRRKVPLRLRRKGPTILPSPRSFGSPQVGVCRLNSTLAFASGNPKTWLRDDWCSPFWGTFLDWQRALWVPSSLKTTSTIRPWPKNHPYDSLACIFDRGKNQRKQWLPAWSWRYDVAFWTSRVWP